MKRSACWELVAMSPAASRQHIFPTRNPVPGPTSVQISSSHSPLEVPPRPSFYELAAGATSLTPRAGTLHSRNELRLPGLATRADHLKLLEVIGPFFSCTLPLFIRRQLDIRVELGQTISFVFIVAGSAAVAATPAAHGALCLAHLVQLFFCDPQPAFSFHGLLHHDRLKKINEQLVIVQWRHQTVHVPPPLLCLWRHILPLLVPVRQTSPSR